MCRILRVSPSGFYAWKLRPPSKRQLEDEELTKMICSIHAGSRGIYGAPRIHDELKDDHNIGCGEKRVARLMKAAGIEGCHRRRKRRGTTKKDRRATTAPDLVDRNFSSSEPNRLWTADIKYLPTDEGNLYLSAVVDVFSRKVVGWSMTDDLTVELVVDALDMAYRRRRPDPGVIHHSDHGSQYTALAFGRRCREARVVPSMGSVGDCYDNAVSEAFFATLQCERLDGCRFATREQARAAVFDYIEVFYNRRRRHSSTGGVSPEVFEQRHASKTQSEAA